MIKKCFKNSLLEGNQRVEGGDHSLRKHEEEISRLQRDPTARPNSNLPPSTRLRTNSRMHCRQVFRREIQAQIAVSSIAVEKYMLNSWPIDFISIIALKKKYQCMYECTV